VLSPALFNLFVNTFIVNLKVFDISCHNLDQYFGCQLYADKLILLLPSFVGLQDMLKICQETATLLSLCSNANKCHCISFGKNFTSKVGPVSIGACCIDWCNSIKYLGVCIASGKSFSFDVNPV
jgi:hypothetical protein